MSNLPPGCNDPDEIDQAFDAAMEDILIESAEMTPEDILTAFRIGKAALESARSGYVHKDELMLLHMDMAGEADRRADAQQKPHPHAVWAGDIDKWIFYEASSDKIFRLDSQWEETWRGILLPETIARAKAAAGVK